MLRDDVTGALSRNDLWIMAAINWAGTIAIIAVLSKVLNRGRMRRPRPQALPLANMYGAGRSAESPVRDVD